MQNFSWVKVGRVLHLLKCCIMSRKRCDQKQNTLEKVRIAHQVPVRYLGYPEGQVKRSEAGGEGTGG